jgi:O-acetylserine/cysteine efflux transporter
MSTLPATLSLRHGLLAVAVMAVWGCNFVIIRIGLDHLPPLLFATLRFVFALFPAVLFLPKPAVPWRNLILYGVLIGGGQFALLFIAMRSDITPALASLVLQTQVFFTIGLSVYLNGERVRVFHIVALSVTVAGLAIILRHTDGSTTMLGLCLVLGAALCWAAGNMVARSTPQVDMLSYVVWSSLFAVPPLLAASLAFEGWPVIRDGLVHANAAAWGAVLCQSVGNTLFGYAVWGWLLARYPVAAVAPTALLVPVFGIGASAIWLGEPMQNWKLEAAGLVMAGLCINFLWPKLSAVRADRIAATRAT